MYYNYQRMARDLYCMMSMPENKEYECTLRLMLDETIFHFLEEYNVPFERQEEFLTTMFYDCPKAITDYKTKRFELS